MKEKTGWYGETQKPVRRGIYETRLPSSFGGWTEGFSRWSGRKWGFQCGSLRQAIEISHKLRGTPFKQWRGLAKEPKK